MLLVPGVVTKPPRADRENCCLRQEYSPASSNIDSGQRPDASFLKTYSVWRVQHSFPEKTLIRVLVVDDYKPWYEFVAVTLKPDPKYKVVGLATDGVGALKAYDCFKPDVILLDINLPGSNGFAVAKKLREVAPSAKIVFFTNQISTEFVTAAFEAGARGFVAKRDVRELLQALDTVVSGEKYLSERVREIGEPASGQPLEDASL
jgi:DNA-binding NarL/FixJ family response regulator